MTGRKPKGPSLQNPLNRAPKTRIKSTSLTVTPGSYTSQAGGFEQAYNKAVYARRKCTAEPVFGIIKAVTGFRQFLLRGLDQVAGEWNLVCIAYNIKRLYALN